MMKGRYVLRHHNKVSVKYWRRMYGFLPIPTKGLQSRAIARDVLV